MTILIANIGTSDLSIKIDNYYIPVGFDRSEPNIDYFGLDNDEEAIWEHEMRRSYIAEYLCPELNVKVNNGKFSFRELTLKILETYEKDEETWYHRIRPGRIWGVIQSAMAPNFKVNEVYLFVTDQPETEKQGYPSDSIHLFDILDKWFRRQIPKLKLHKKVIPQDIPANKQDPLLNYYYQFFNSIDTTETVLISIKGGTPQMQTAIKMQAIASGISKQLFIEPRLSIKKVLAGEASECQLTSYWRYMRTQKYQAVKLLLEERWDFDGAQQILKDWDKVLKFVIQEKGAESDINSGKIRLDKIVTALNVGVHYMNLDYQSAIKEKNSPLGADETFTGWMTDKGDEKLLNLYTQCRIYWEINQIANFLARMSSFYEATLERLIVILNGEKYFDAEDNSLNIHLVRQEVGESLWQDFYDSQKGFTPDLKNNKSVKLLNRLAKRNFIEKILVPGGNISKEWDYILTLLQSLEFWAKQRNNVTHSSIGVSKQKMHDLWNYKGKANNACPPGKIIEVMGNICQSELKLVRDEYQQSFIAKTDLYLYTNIKQWVLTQLHQDSKL